MSGRKQAEQQSPVCDPKARVAAIRETLDCHPEELLLPVDSGSDVLSWVEEIFKVIGEAALHPGNERRVQHLAKAGAYLAGDFANYLGSESERLRDSLIASGCIASGAE